MVGSFFMTGGCLIPVKNGGYFQSHKRFGSESILLGILFQFIDSGLYAPQEFIKKLIVKVRINTAVVVFLYFLLREKLLQL